MCSGRGKYHHTVYIMKCEVVCSVECFCTICVECFRTICSVQCKLQWLLCSVSVSNFRQITLEHPQHCTAYIVQGRLRDLAYHSSFWSKSASF